MRVNVWIVHRDKKSGHCTCREVAIAESWPFVEVVHGLESTVVHVLRDLPDLVLCHALSQTAALQQDLH